MENAIKVFGKAIHSLSKIGEELYIEPLEDGLALKTVNSSRSAFSCFVFAPAFFLNYDDGRAIVEQGQGDGNEEEVVKCKIGMKSCLSVFKSLSTLEKTVDRCKISLNIDQARLVFQLYCRHGIVKTHNLAFIECETLQAVFSRDLLPNRLTAQSRLLCDVVMNFQSNQEEVSLTVSPEKLAVKNYTDDEPDPQKVIHTEMSLDPDEFENYQVGIDGEITFCLKELRAILAFSEGNNLPLSISFETAGKPVVMSIDSDPSFEANFVLATLADPSSQVSCSQQSTQVNRNSQRKHNHTNSIHDVSHRNTMVHKPATNHKTHIGLSAVQESMKKDATRKAHNKQSMSESYQCMSNDLQTDDLEVQRRDQSNHMEIDTTAMKNVTNIGHKSKDTLSSTSTNEMVLNSRISQEDDTSPVIPLQNKTINMAAELSLVDVEPEEEEEEEDMVPGTPPSKKFKSSVFFGISQNTSTQHSTVAADQSIVHRPATSQPHAPNVAVLAEDTDDEDD